MFYWVVDSGLLSIRIMVSSYFLIAVTEFFGLKDNMLNLIIKLYKLSYRMLPFLLRSYAG